MKIYCYSTLPIKDYVQTAKGIDGIALTIYASNILAGNSYNENYLSTLQSTIKKIGTYNKKVSIGIQFGSTSSNTIYSAFPFVYMTRKSHQGTGSPVAVKLPCFYDDGYLNKLNETINWFAASLKKDLQTYSLIESIKITGCNESSLEMRATAQDWTSAHDSDTAYSDAAAKWKLNGYTYEKSLSANADIIDVFVNNFPDKILLLPYIGGLNGFPCIDTHDEICLPKKRPDLTKTLLTYSNKVIPQYTAYDGTTQGEYMQINQKKYGTPQSPYNDSEFRTLLNTAQANGVQNLECFDLDILHYPQLFQ